MRPRPKALALLAALVTAAPMAIMGSTGAAWAGESVLLPAPTVSSTDYPDDGNIYDGVGIYGDFVIDDPSDQAVRYNVSLNGRSLPEVPTTDGAPVTITLAPRRSGPNLLEAQSFGPQGENGPRTTYSFRARTGSAAKAHWNLDEPADSRAFTGAPRGDGEPVIARAHGRVSAGADGQLDTAARFDGGYTTADPVVDTSRSFTMVAWAKPSRVGDFVVLAQAGQRANAFSLEARDGDWAFVMPEADSPGAPATQAVATATIYPDTWAHLVGSYDATQKRLRLYVNGTLAADVPSGDGAWNAQQGLRMGAGVKTRGHRGNVFRGLLDEVRVFDRIILPEEVTELRKVPAELRGHWRFNTDGTDVTGNGNDATLRDGAVIDPAAGARWSSVAGLALSGTGAHAETATPPIRTDESFSVTAWVDTSTLPDRPATLLSLPGEHVNRFAVRWVPGPDGRREWQLSMTDSDTADTRVTVAGHSWINGSWDHIGLVYDAPTRTMSLYVNSEIEHSSSTQSVKSGVLPWNGAGGLQIGRSALGDPEYWEGYVDDVRAFQGALNEEDIFTDPYP